ncbi:MAG: hypothetical protein CME62_00845 [Halobacteriovoraceae bacterium]|nr:hypothetical protein [Halobacteriovoraceae bacterium]|tara:strand:+ start:4819 stop:5556 length:738 start_codon:yes stop_codon:yes gene_type:complete
MKSLGLIAILFLSSFSYAQELGADFEAKVREMSQVDTSQNKSLPMKRISRAEVMANAYAALNYTYTVSEDNYTSARLKNSCEGQNNWLRPYRFYGKIGVEQKGIPYKWGGYFLDLRTFTNGVLDGKATGDVCTCGDPKRGYCITGGTIGLDCSGFVSFVWQTGYYTTSRMHQITHQIKWSQLKKGDALNKPGDHVILFESYSKDKNYIVGIDSSTSCEGVCKRSFRKYDLEREGFKPVRFNSIRD